MFLLDTSVVSYIVRKDPLAKLYHAEVTSGMACYVSAQTLGEMYLGARAADWGTERRRRMEVVLARFVVLAIDSGTARQYGDLVHAAGALGRPLSPPDAWIMAAAKQYGLTLVSHDRDMLVGGRLGIEVVCRA